MEAQLGKNIFVIDDNKMFCLMLKEALSKISEIACFNIHVFENAEDCQSSLHLNPELVIVDFHLDSKNETAINGLEAVNLIRNVSPLSNFIMITNNQETELFVKSKQYDIYDYIIKGPLVAFKLNLSIQQWLNFFNSKNKTP